MICAPNQLRSTVPTVQRPCPLYFLRAELREVAEYFDKMQDLADEYYENGTPHPLELRTSVTKNGKNV